MSRTAAGQREHGLSYYIGIFLKTNSAISSLWSSAKLGVEHPNSSQRDVESGEKKNLVVELNLSVVISRSRNQTMNSWVSQLPTLVFTHSCLSWVSRILQSCSSRQTTPSARVPRNPGAARPSPRGGSRRILPSEVSAPAAPLDTCPALSTAVEVDFSLELIA